MARMTIFRLLPARVPAFVLEPIVRRLAAIGVTPMALSVAGLAGNAAAAILISRGALFTGGAVMLLASALDLLDGALARSTNTASTAGALVDSTLDRVSEAVVLFGVLIYMLGANRDVDAMLAFVAVVGSMMVSYVRARAEGLGLSMTDGLFTRAERVLLLGAALILGYLSTALWLLAVLTSLTALQRLLIGMRALRERRR
ncbi:MAG: CDP-alcohol phosphatidyltransferase family protein [Dehalococcoidia bacterium]|nr:CDP-alcohol phosphatidyltransferase family protein [Dehalococcoidia bacterium]